MKAGPAWTKDRRKQHLQSEEKEKDAWEFKFTKPKLIQHVQTLHTGACFCFYNVG